MRFVDFVIALGLAGFASVGAACEPPGYGHKGDPDAPASDKSMDGATTHDAAIDAPTSGVCADMFRLDGYGSAGTCWVTGDFDQWGVDPDHGAFVLAKGSDGAWTGTREFEPGTYQYKFVVDGTMWIPDPNNPNVVDDGFGGHNSVYTCAL